MKVTSIRFNLKFFNANGEEQVVRSLDELSEKFNLCDLWDYFKSGDLVRWLKSLNESALAEQVGTLTFITDKQIAMSKLCEALKLAVASDEILELSEALDRQDMMKIHHKKVGTFQNQEDAVDEIRSGISADLVGFENTYYIDNFNLIMQELWKFQSNEDFVNVEKLKGFEQKFNRVLNNWGILFIRDFLHRISTEMMTWNLRYCEALFANQKIYNQYDSFGNVVHYKGQQSVDHQYIPYFNGWDLLVWSLLAITRWGSYLSYMSNYSIPVCDVCTQNTYGKRGGVSQSQVTNSKFVYSNLLRLTPPEVGSTYLFLTNESPVRKFPEGLQRGFQGLIF